MTDLGKPPRSHWRRWHFRHDVLLMLAILAASCVIVALLIGSVSGPAPHGKAEAYTAE
jgi:hypothetical protein